MERQQRKYANKKSNACILQFGTESIFKAKVSRFKFFMQINSHLRGSQAEGEKDGGRKPSFPFPFTHIGFEF